MKKTRLVFKSISFLFFTFLLILFVNANANSFIQIGTTPEAIRVSKPTHAEMSCIGPKAPLRWDRRNVAFWEAY